MLSNEDPATVSGPGAITFEERVQMLAPIGLPRRQTEFVVTVALNGGYCLQRQYDAFVGRRHGQVASDLFDRLITQRLATRVRLARHRGYIYHLHAKGLYRALGQEDNRNRRRASAAQIARKLMVLDYVIAAPNREWLATEHDKVVALTTRFNVPMVDLPRRRYRSRGDRLAPTYRYFVNKLPIAMADGELAVEFVYLVLDKSGAGFETFLHDHARLLGRLSVSTIVAICPRQLDGLPACRQVFRQRLSTTMALASGQLNREDLRWFFRAHLAIDRNDLRSLSVADLNRYRELRTHLATPAVERLFVAWQALGDSALANIDGQQIEAPASQVRLAEYTLPFGYEQFGSMPGLA
jgi:hypothetical protein